MKSVRSMMVRVAQWLGIGIGVLVLLAILAWHAPFPRRMLEFRDARIYGRPGEVSAFSVRVTNNHAVCGATRIKVRIDFFGKDGKAIDGREIVLDGTVPSGNTRLIGEPYVGITGLPEPDGWTWTYTVVDAAASSLWCGSWFGMEP